MDISLLKNAIEYHGKELFVKITEYNTVDAPELSKLESNKNLNIDHETDADLTRIKSSR